MIKYLFITASLLFSFQASAQNALIFDGIDDYVQCANPGPIGSQSRTVEFWVKTTISSASQKVMVDWGDMSTGSRYTFNIINGIPRIEVGGNGLNAATGIADGSWHHLATTYDNSAAIKYKIYIDGVLSSSIANLATPINTSSMNGIIIGRRNDATNNFPGTIDEVRVWNIARTQTEIQAAMNKEYCTTPPNLVAYFKFNQGTASGNNIGQTTLIDASGSNNNGTLSNFTLTGSASNWITGKPISGINAATISPAACDSYTSPSGLYTYTVSGTYKDTLTNVFGCDSLLTIVLTVTTIDTSVTQNGGAFIANAIGATYQWLDCNNGFSPINGATASIFTPTSNGSYCVRISKNGCIDTSACYSITNVGLNELSILNNEISLYPNPSDQHFTILCSTPMSDLKIKIFTMDGKCVFRKIALNGNQFDIDVSDLQSGMYLVELNEKGIVKSITLEIK